jgi:hypothetical protein
LLTKSQQKKLFLFFVSGVYNTSSLDICVGKCGVLPPPPGVGGDIGRFGEKCDLEEDLKKVI